MTTTGAVSYKTTSITVQSLCVACGVAARSSAELPEGPTKKPCHARSTKQRTRPSRHPSTAVVRPSASARRPEVVAMRGELAPPGAV